MYSLLNVKDWSSIKQNRTQSSSTIHSQLVVSRKRLWWNLKTSYTRKCMCHLDHHRRFPTRLIERAMRILMWQEALKTSNESNKNPIPNYPVQRDLLLKGEKKPWNVPSLIATLYVTDPKSTGKPVCGHESTKRCVLTPKHVENDQTGTGRPVTVDQKEENEIDFRVPGLSHSVVKEAEHLRVQELVKRIENHLHRAALHADLQQNNVCSPFSNKSKAMIRELGNVELFGLYETTPKVQCSHCLLYCNQGFVYCTCGQCLIDSESRRKFNKLRLESLSIPNYVIKKGATHGARHGKTEVQREYHLAWSAWKRCCNSLDSHGEHFTGIRDRFLRDPVYRESQLAIGWSEPMCKEWDELAKEDHTYKKNSLQRKGEGTKDNGNLLWTKQANMVLWSFDLITEPLSWWKIAYTTNQENQLKSPSIQVNKDAYVKDKNFSPNITCPALELINIQDGNIGLHLQVPRGGTHPNGVGSELTIFLLQSFFFVAVGFVYSW